MLRDRIESFLKENQVNCPPFNSLLANLYRGEKDSIVNLTYFMFYFEFGTFFITYLLYFYTVKLF